MRASEDMDLTVCPWRPFWLEASELLKQLSSELLSGLSNEPNQTNQAGSLVLEKKVYVVVENVFLTRSWVRLVPSACATPSACVRACMPEWECECVRACVRKWEWVERVYLHPSTPSGSTTPCNAYHSVSSHPPLPPFASFSWSIMVVCFKSKIWEMLLKIRSWLIIFQLRCSPSTKAPNFEAKKCSRNSLKASFLPRFRFVITAWPKSVSFLGKLIFPAMKLGNVPLKLCHNTTICHTFDVYRILLYTEVIWDIQTAWYATAKPFWKSINIFSPRYCTEYFLDEILLESAWCCCQIFVARYGVCHPSRWATRLGLL